MNWQWLLGGIILVVIVVGLYVQMLTARHKTYVTSRRLREKRFRPDWDRGRDGSGTRRKGIRIRR